MFADIITFVLILLRVRYLNKINVICVYL